MDVDVRAWCEVVGSMLAWLSRCWRRERRLVGREAGDDQSGGNGDSMVCGREVVSPVAVDIVQIHVPALRTHKGMIDMAMAGRSRRGAEMRSVLIVSGGMPLRARRDCIADAVRGKSDHA